MRTVIYLSNQEVRILVGSVTGKKITIEKEIYALAPSRSISDGKITDEAAFLDFFQRLRDKNNIPMKEVILVLSNSSALTRRLQTPQMSVRKTMACLAREFAGVERSKDPVYAYTVLKKDRKIQTILANMVERDYLEAHMHFAAKAGIRLVSVVMSLTANIAMLKRLPQLEKGAVVIQSLEGTSIKNLLLIDGEFFYFHRNRIRSEKGTPAFGVECARAVNKLQQFLRSQQIEKEITTIYLAGEYEGEVFELVQDSMLQMNAELEVQMLAEGSEHPAVGYSGLQAGQFHRFLPLMGALLVPNDRRNLLYQMKYYAPDMTRKRKLMNHLMPLLLTFLILGGISVLQVFRWFAALNQLEQQYDFLDNSRMLENIAEYDRMAMQNEELTRQIQLAESTWNNLQSYPAISTQVKQVVAACMEGMGTAEIKEYHAAEGVIVIDIKVTEAALVHQFIMKLEEHPDTFEELQYNGFVFDEREENWKAEVTCYLSRPGSWEQASQSAAEQDGGRNPDRVVVQFYEEVTP
ncbi:MAG: hypothetical protein ACRDBO_08215 [Lachnospiraceae bacterium]